MPRLDTLRHRAAGLAAVMVALSVIAVACTSAPVPVLVSSSSPPPPTAVVSPSPLPDVLSIVLHQSPTMPLDIADRSGHLAAAVEATSAELAQLAFPSVATAYPGPTATDLFVGWMGGLCDASATLTVGVDPNSVAIEIVRQATPTPREGVVVLCPDVGLERAVKLTFDEPVADIGRPRATQPVVPASPPPSVSPVPTPGVSPAAPTGIAWRAVTSPVLVGLTFTSMTVWDRGFVALGEDSSHQLVVVRSPDGVTWRRSALPGSRPNAAGGASVDGQRAQVAADGSRLTIVATLGNVDGHGTNHLAFWTSTDAVDWTRVPDEPSFDVGGGGVTEAFVVDGTFYVTATGDLEFWDDVEAIFRSADGSHWTRIPRRGHNGSGVIIVRPGVHGLVGVVRVGDEGFRIARSTDGEAWTNLGQTPQDRQVMVWQLPAGYLAANELADGVPLAMAASPADASWTPTKPDPTGPAAIWDVAVSGSRAVGVGSRVDVDGSPCCGAYAVVSTDGGASWTASSGWPDMADACMSTVALNGQVAVAVGACEESRYGPAVWVATLP